MSFFTATGDYSGARKYLIANYEILNSSPDSVKVEYLLELGKVSTILQEDGEGFKNLQKALELAESTGNSYLIHKSQIQLLEFYRKIREYSSAQELIQTINRNLPTDPELLCRFYHRTAAVYNELYDAKNGAFPKRLDTSLEYSYKSLQISKKHNFLDHQYTSYREISGTYKTTSKLASTIKASLYMDSALVTLNQKDLFAYNNLLKAKAHNFFVMQKFDSSLLYAKKALPFMDSLNYYDELMDIYWVISQSYNELGDSLSGLKFRLLEAQTDVKFRDVQSKNNLEELTTQYKVEVKDKLIAEKEGKLVKANEEKKFFFYIGVLLFIIFILTIIYSIKTKRKNKLLAKLIKENDFLVGESNHRIKNNLQLIISLLGREIFKGTENSEKLGEISDKINAIATLHQQLYLDESKDTIRLDHYIKQLKENLNSNLIGEEIIIELEVCDCIVTMDKAVYIGLLITELVTNSIKYAFKNIENKSIKIIVDEKEKKLYLHYKDSGVGIKNNETPALVNLITKQLKAEIHSVSNLGYQLKLVFKK